MSKSVRSYAGWFLALAVVSMSIDTRAFADSIESQPLLLFRVINSVQVSDEVVENAKKHVQRIYRESGIQVEWIANNEAPNVTPGRKTLTLTIVLVSESLARVMGQPDSTTGFAISNDGRGTRIAYVFAERAERQAETVSQLRLADKKTAEGLILGHVIAHESGHLMLPHNSHSCTGIMSAKMDRASIDQALRGYLFFSSEQGRLMRTALVNQARTK
jgi:hypothetical protein